VTIRDTRLQAAIVRDQHLLLVQITLPDATAFWVLPGGGREAGESDADGIMREVREELGVDVVVGDELYDVPAEPPDGTYARWRTFACQLVHGEPAATGPDGAADLTAVRWLPLIRRESWDIAVRQDAFLYPQLERIAEAVVSMGNHLPRAAG
jgi:8-oxo-dGTP diphosphatase